MTVDVDSYPSPTGSCSTSLAQTRSLEPTPEGTHVTLAFDASLKLGVIGRLAGRVLARRLGIEGILDAYETVMTAVPFSRPISTHRYASAVRASG